MNFSKFLMSFTELEKTQKYIFSLFFSFDKYFRLKFARGSKFYYLPFVFQNNAEYVINNFRVIVFIIQHTSCIFFSQTNRSPRSKGVTLNT